MRWINNLTIRWKLALITLITAAIAALFAGTAITLYTENDYSAQKLQQAVVQTRVLAASLAAALVFNDQDATQEYLEALRASREIAAAGVYNADGTMVARYTRADSPSGLLPSRAPAGASRFEGDKLLVSQPVDKSGNTVGSVYLVVDTEPFATRLIRVGGLMLLAVLGSLLIAVPISMRLNTGITKPIQEIAAAASRVTAGDLSPKLTPTPRTDEIGVLMRVFGQMVSSLRETMQSERLRALGQLSSGVAHDINNAITPIAIYTESLLEHEPNLSPNTRNYLEIVQRVVDDVTATVGRMREFSRKRDPETTLTPVNLNRLVQQVIDLTRARWSDMQQQRGVMISVRTDLTEDLPHIMGMEGELREALTNLIFNATDAMPNGGTITLRTRSIAADERVTVEVIDTGIGMDEETRRRCFEPFFTTKGEQGTGLGMAMVYGVAQRHRGEIEIESEVGKGTTARLIFAAHELTASEMPAHKPPVALPHPLRILIVDDDPSVLDSMQIVLELDDHTVITAGGGQAGIDAFRTALEEGNPFSVVITDLGMPYVDGSQVASAVKQLSPSTPVVLLTGWGEHATADGDNAPLVNHVMGKPPHLDELREVLSRYA